MEFGITIPLQKQLGVAAPIKIDASRNCQKAHGHFVNTCVCKAAGFEERETPLEFLEKDMRRRGIV